MFNGYIIYFLFCFNLYKAHLQRLEADAETAEIGRVVITKNMIAFSLIDDTTMIDQIPLHEVQSVQKHVQAIGKENKDAKQSRP
jgi:hypothetical protein